MADRRRKSILFVATDLSLGGGVNKVIGDLSRLLQEKLGARVVVISARSNKPSSVSFSAGVEVRVHAKSLGLVGYAKILYAIRREHFDFVIGPWTQDNILITLALLFSDSKVVLMEHSQSNYHGWLIRVLRRIVYPLAWRVLALNPEEFAYYRRFLSNVRLVPNPVARPTSIDVARERLIIGVGHLSRLKNFEDALRAMALSRLEQEGWEFSIIGDGPEKEKLLNLIRELGLRRTTIQPPTADIQRWYARASLLIHTSKTEVFPMVLAESMAAGVVPIAYELDGRKFLLEQFPEHLVPSGDVETLSARLSKFADDDLSSLGAKLRRSVSERFSPEIVGDMWHRLLIEDVGALG